MKDDSAFIIGTWRLVSFEFRKDDGDVIYPFGARARGSFIYTESGRFSAQLMRKDRPHLASKDQMTGTAAEIDANYKGCISYFGKYEVDETESVIIHYVEGSLFPNMEGTKQVRYFELSENRLQLKTPPTNWGGEKAVGILLWERIG